jgi:hypothetical protein
VQESASLGISPAHWRSGAIAVPGTFRDFPSCAGVEPDLALFQKPDFGQGGGICFSWGYSLVACLGHHRSGKAGASSR